MSITITNKLIIEECEKLGIDYTIISEKHNLIELKYRDKKALVRRAVTPVTSAVLRYVADHKDATYDILKYYGFGVPDSKAVSSLDQAIDVAQTIGYSLVVKPEDSAYGLGVTVSVTDEESLKKAYEYAYSINEGEVIVQRFIPGEDYRVMIVGYKVVAIAQRIPCRVLGNGKTNINDLIKKENENPLRGLGKSSPMSIIEVDNNMIDYLKLQNLSLESVPKKGEYIYLRKIANLSTGGEAIDITAKSTAANNKMFEEMAECMQASVVGIDIRCEDITKNLSTEDYAVIEVNASPGIRMHHYPSKGKPINVAKKILEALFPDLK